MQTAHLPSLNETLSRSIDLCHECKNVCTAAVGYCLDQGGRHAEPNHIRLLRSCAEICQTTVNFMLRGADLLPTVAIACAEVCGRCAESCATFDEDITMQRCAEVCRRCAEVCAGMALASR